MNDNDNTSPLKERGTKLRDHVSKAAVADGGTCRERGHKSLMYKSMSLFLICAAAVFLITAPLFYFLTKHFYAEDMIDIIESVKSGHGIPPLDLERDIMEGLMLQYLLTCVVIAFSLFITLRFVTRRLWQPFDDTLRKTESFRLAQSDVPTFANTDIREFASLNSSIERLMRKDKETFRIQKEFTENASHELQTPLAVIRGKLDLLMQENLSKRQMLLLADINRQTIRIGNLNRNLLLLAKIDNAQYLTTEEIDLENVVSAIIPMCEVFGRDVFIRFNDNAAHHKFMIRANETLLESMLKNLIVNAIRNTAAGGEITIVTQDGLLTVSNPSADGVPLDRDKLFMRFNTTGTHGSGNGLGLAIVKAICDFHGWKVEYVFEKNMHKFKVDFNRISQ